MEIITQIHRFMEKLTPQYGGKSELVREIMNPNSEERTMRPNQRNIYNLLKHSKRASISEPPGAGKSMAISFVMAYRLANWQDHKSIIIVPQTFIAKSFGKDVLKFDDGSTFMWDSYYDLCNSSNDQKVDIVINFLKKKRFSNNPNERSLITTHMAFARAFDKDKIKYSDELFDNTSLTIDEAHHIMYAKCTDSSFITNRIGKLVKNINGHPNCSLWLVTATPFRGDKNSIIPKEQMSTFDMHYLPLDKHWKDNIKYIQSFDFKFIIYKMGEIFDGVKTVIKNKRKTIIFCPYRGHLVKNGDKNTFKNELIRNIKTVWPEANIMDLINTDGREQKKSILLNNKEAEKIDIILTLKIFDEGSDWVCAEQCIDLNPSDTLRIMYQRFGRLWRDFFKKSKIEYYCFLPHESNFTTEESRREHLSDMYNIFVATLLMQETIDPLPYPVNKKLIKGKDHIKTEDFQNPLDKVTDNENERTQIVHDVIDKILIMSAHNPDSNSNEIYQWIESVLDEHGITDDKDDTIKYIAKILRRHSDFITISSKPEWDGNSIDISWMRREAGFDKIWSADIPGNLLMFATRTCGIKHFEEFRKLYSNYKSIDEWVEIAKKLIMENNGNLPSIVWLRANNYGGLVMAIHKFPERFIHLEIKRLGIQRSLDEWIVIAERLVAEFGKLPSYAWVKDNDFGGLFDMIRKYPKQFEHLPIPKKTERKSLEEWVKIAEKLVKENGGKLPSNTWLRDNNYKAMTYTLLKYPKHFEHLQQIVNLKSIDEWVEIAEKLAEENGGILPTNKWLKDSEYNALTFTLLKYPDKFSHIKRISLLKSTEEWMRIAKELIKENGGTLPSYKIMKSKGYGGLRSFLRRYQHDKKVQELITNTKYQAYYLHQNMRCKRKSQNEWVQMAEELAKVNNGKLPPYKWLKSNPIYSSLPSMISNHPTLFAHLK